MRGAGLAWCSLVHRPAQATEPPREGIEWSDIWIANVNDHNLPHVLLIGDSITRGYWGAVSKDLAGKAYVSRLTTSQFLADPLLLGQIQLFLTHFKFDVIHFNNGMHGFDKTEDAYRAGFPAYLAAIRDNARGAKLIWATTTPVVNPAQPDKVDARTPRIQVRNSIAQEYVSQAGIPVDDLFSFVQPHPEYHKGPDGVHYTDAGYAAEGAEVAGQIEKLLPPAGTAPTATP